MRIEPGSSLEWHLAQYFADLIYHRVIEQHLWLIGSETQHWKAGDSQFAEMQSAIQSLKGAERSNFVAALGWLFKEKRKAAGLDIRGRDYVAKVRAREAADLVAQFVTDSGQRESAPQGRNC